MLYSLLPPCRSTRTAIPRPREWTIELALLVVRSSRRSRLAAVASVARRLGSPISHFHTLLQCHPMDPDIGPEAHDFANVFGISCPTPIPKFTTRFAGGTETRRRGPRKSEIGVTLVYSTLTCFDCQSRICANSLFGEEEEGDSQTPVPLQQYHGGNLSVIPSQESPQIHAISSESLCLRGEIPSFYGMLVTLLRTSDSAPPYISTIFASPFLSLTSMTLSP